MIEIIRQAAGFLSRSERRRWLLLVPLSLIAALLETAAAAMMLWLIQGVLEPLASAGSSGGAQVDPTDLGRWIDRVGDVSRRSLALGVALVFVVKNLVRLAEAYLRARLASDCAGRLGARLLGGYLRAPWPRHLEWNSATLIQNTTAGADTICTTVLLSATAAASELLVVGAILIVLAFAAPGGVPVVIAMIAIAVALLLWLTQRRFERWGAALNTLAAESLRSLQETLALAKVVKVLGRESFFERAFAALRASMTTVMARRAALASLPRLALETVFVVAVAVVVAVAGGNAADAAGSIAFVGFAAYAGLRILPSVHLAVYHLNNVRSGKAIVDELARDWTQLVVAPASPRDIATAAMPFERAIEVRDVSFSYAGGSREALRGVSLAIRRGESVGVIGRTGSGKSTLLDLLLGLLEPAQGAILVDGVDVRASPRAWQANVGYVPQDPVLVDDSIRRNIALGLEDAEIDAERIGEAARLARLEELLSRLPRGLDTVSGERGVRLSGGERQRIAIARALYQRPRVLVFDEATAALDARTESELRAGIELLRGSRTLIIVAHRLSMVRDCDRVFVLRDGELADEGTAAELVARHPGLVDDDANA